MVDRRSVLVGGIAAPNSIAQALLTIGMPPAPETPTAGALSVREFGAVGDGRADDRAAVQRAYDTLAKRGGGQLFFPQGSYRIALTLTSRAVHLRGTGASSSILIPVDAELAAITALYRNGSIAPVSITDLGFRGFGRPSALFSAGGTRYITDAEYSGGTHFARCAFNGAERCIERRHGTIDLQIDQCQFANADYHVHVTTPAADSGADPMHGGCLVLRRSWLSGFDKAMLFVESPVTGSGQIVLEQNVVDGGRGFVHYFTRFQGSRAPGIVIRDQWNERTATATDLTIGGRRHPRALFLYADRVKPAIVLENTPPGPVALRSTSLVTRGCDLSDLDVDADRDSSIMHERASALTGTVPGRTLSMAAPIQADPLRSPWFRMPLPNARALAFAAQTLFVDDCAGPLTLTGSRRARARMVPGDAALPGIAACAEFSLQEGDVLFPPVTEAAPAGHWLVAMLICRMVTGEAVAQVSGSRGMSGAARLTSGFWETFVTLCRPVETAVAGISIHLSSRATSGKDSAGEARIRLGGIALVASPSLPQALDFANALIFPGLGAPS